MGEPEQHCWPCPPGRCDPGKAQKPALGGLAQNRSFASDALFSHLAEDQQNTWSCCKSVNTSIIKNELKLHLVPMTWSHGWFNFPCFTFYDCQIQVMTHKMQHFIIYLCNLQNVKHF